MTEDKNLVKMPHHIIMEERRNLTVSGVMDVDSFDEQNVVVYTQLGELVVEGRQLHIIKLNVETGELNLEGEITSLTYMESQKKQSGGSMLSKFFR